uniref:Uncharacterized protein n=1 Tax=viral metagenome TaxID=1070528 RepID=A0A6C0IB69_9ZZZZ
MVDIKNIEDFDKQSDKIGDIYMGHMTYYSITLDLIALYLKGQKLLYVESKTFCEHCLYRLMLPTIFISAVCTVLSLGLQDYSRGGIVVSSLTGFNSFLLAVVTYTKLDAKAEAHKTTAYQFDKLQTSCEFYSGKTLLLKDHDVSKKVTEFVESVEKKVVEIKDVNQFIIPEVVRFRYNDIYSYNVFAIMKQYKTTRLLNTQYLININNRIDEFEELEETETAVPDVVINIEPNSKSSLFNNLFKINVEPHEEEELLDIYSKKTKLSDLLKERDRLIGKIIEYRNISISLNEKFDKLVNKHITKQKNMFDLLGWLKN